MRTRQYSHSMSRRRIPSSHQRSEYYRLLTECTMVGRDAAVTNVRTGSRKSINLDVTAEVAENAPDYWITDGLWQFGAMNGAANLCEPTVTNWAADAGLTVTEPESNVYRIAWNGVGTPNVYDAITDAFNNRHARCQARIVSGTPLSSSLFSFWRASSTGTPYTLDNLTSEWQTIDCSITSAERSTYILFHFEGGSAFTIEVRFVRAIDSTVAHAAFPDGSAAAAAYGDDLPTCSPTYPSTGYAIIPFRPYGWATTGNPANAQPLIFEAGSFTVGLDASGFFTTSGGAVSTKKPAANALSIIVVTWDGVNHTISVDDETPVSAASIVVPTGDLYLGNTALGSKSAHAALGALINSGTITADRRTIFNGGIADRLSGATFR